MPITRMDHFTVLTRDANATAAFYQEILELESGPRPNFGFPVVWLYCDGKPILHVIELRDIPSGSGVIDHMAFSGTDLAGLVARLKARSIDYRLQRVPDGAPTAGVWQLFFFDPNGARVEVDLPASESEPV